MNEVVFFGFQRVNRLCARKLGCADLVFKDVYLMISAKACFVLTKEELEKLIAFAAERMKEGLIPSSGRRVRTR